MRHLDDWLNVGALDDLDVLDFVEPGDVLEDVAGALESLSQNLGAATGAAAGVLSGLSDTFEGLSDDFAGTASAAADALADRGPDLGGAIGLGFLEPMFQKPEGVGGGPKNKDGDVSSSEPVLVGTIKYGEADLYESEALINDFYNIEIDFYGSAAGDWDVWESDSNGGDSLTFLSAFEGAANFLTGFIANGLHSDSYDSRVVDDIVIRAYLSDIDGAGGVLGRAGPESARSDDGDNVIDGLTVTGLMEFDVADADILLNGGSFGKGDTVEGGLWYDTVLHEMIHVLGFGTLWGVSNEQLPVSHYSDEYGASLGYQGVPAWDNLVGDNAIFDHNNGTNRPTDDEFHYNYRGGANNLYDAGGSLAVEANGGSGTARGHWDEYTHGNEIMTGYINSTKVDGNYNYMEDYTVAALEDLGYDLGDAPNYEAIAAEGTLFLQQDDPLLVA